MEWSRLRRARRPRGKNSRWKIVSQSRKSLEPRLRRCSECTKERRRLEKTGKVFNLNYSQERGSRYSAVGDVLFIRKSLYYFWGVPYEDMEPRTALPMTKSDYGGKRKILTEEEGAEGERREKSPPSPLIMSHDCELAQSLR